MNHYKKALFTLTILIFHTLCFSHQGGHGPVEKSKIRQWYDVNSNLLAEGSILLAKDDRIVIEDCNGKKTELKLESLSWKDVYYVVTYTREIDKLNSVVNTHHNLPEYNWLEDNVNRVRLISIVGLTLTISLLIFLSRRKGYSWTYPGTLVFTFLITCCVYLIACSKHDVTSTELKSATSDPAVIDLAFTPYQNLVDTRWDDSYFYVDSKGIPDHEMMVGITAWIAQVPIPQDYTGNNAWKIPLKTKYAASPVSLASELRKGGVAIACNGIPIFNPLNASGNVSKDIGELDAYGGHSGRGDDYHYHTAPMHLESTSGNNPIAFALDGYPVYASKEPDGAAMKTLDDFHGHEWSDTYHYHGTNTYPFMIAKMRGSVETLGTKPENEIIPQPPESSLRGNPHPINSTNLVITSLKSRTGGVGYILTYTINGVEGSVEYYWDANGKYTFIFKDVDGKTSTETFQR
ncbi:MAG: YHYH protein [Bacteroidetes bacterium]|nr:YHYH protein [Bacteroidota bacterium]